MSLFEKDLSKEIILGKFLSSRYSKNNLKAKRISDKDIQFKGVDFILEASNGLYFKVDEKAQLHYLNIDLPTFALEIDYLKDGILKDGWLFNSEKITEIYAFIFSIHLIKNLKELNDENDIKSCDVVFVNRIRLIKELGNLGLDFKTCIANSKILRSSEEKKRINHQRSGFNFQISSQLHERPVNLVVKKRFLESVGEKYTFNRYGDTE